MRAIVLSGLRPLCRTLFPVFAFVLYAWSQATMPDGKMNLAVMNLKNAEGITEGEAGLISDRLRVELFNTGKVNVMERNQMQEILKEQGFQQTGACTDEACLVEMGQMLGVSAIVSGSIGKLGSMYMVNLRVIDVQTAQITHVVSDDIKGDIEDVVARLKPIARQLVTPKGAAPPAEVTAKPKPAPLPQVEEPEEEEEEEEEEEAEEADVDDAAAGRRNRPGIRVAIGVFPGRMRMHLYDEYMDKYYDSDSFYTYNDDVLDSLSEEGYDAGVTRTMLSFHVCYMQALGRFFELDIGGGLAFAIESQYLLIDDWTGYLEDDMKFMVMTPNITTGLAFVKWFRRVKLNAGFMIGLNYNIVVTTMMYDNPSIPAYYDVMGTGGKFNVSVGPRVGIEFLLGKRIGLGIEGHYRFSQFETDIAYDDSNWYDETWQFRTPGLGIGGSFNVYFR
jgi:TolB-like protein